MKFVSEIPKPLFDINEILPNEITPNLNGRLPADKLKQLHCGGYLYVDAARSWLAMVRAALADGIFLNLNFVIDAYRTVAAQFKRFKQRFEEIDTTITPPHSIRNFKSNSTEKLGNSKTVRNTRTFPDKVCTATAWRCG